MSKPPCGVCGFYPCECDPLDYADYHPPIRFRRCEVGCANFTDKGRCLEYPTMSLELFGRKKFCKHHLEWKYEGPTLGDYLDDNGEWIY